MAVRVKALGAVDLAGTIFRCRTSARCIRAFVDDVVVDRRIRHRGIARRPLAAMRTLAALAPDRRHVLSIRAHDLSAFAASGARFVTGELVRRTLLMRCLSTLAGDLALLALIHPGKTSSAGPLSFHITS